jgi:hypothetical protein
MNFAYMVALSETLAVFINRYTISESVDQVWHFSLDYILHKEFEDYSSH